MNRRRPYVLLFRAAALHNLGAAMVLLLFPQLFFRWFALPELNHPFLMQGVGLLIGTFGWCYVLLSVDPERYRMIVLPGLFAKMLGAAAWAYWTVTGALPVSAYWLSAANDLVWLPFLVAFLRSSRTGHSGSGTIRL